MLRFANTVMCFLHAVLASACVALYLHAFSDQKGVMSMSFLKEGTEVLLLCGSCNAPPGPRLEEEQNVKNKYRLDSSGQRTAEYPSA